MSYAIRGRVISDGQTSQDQLLLINEDKISFSGPASELHDVKLEGVELIHVPPGGAILPGLVDLHCHGALGGDFPSGDETSSRKALSYLHSSGTTTLLASTVTAPKEDMRKAVRTLRTLVEEGQLAGIHVEGPFLSPARCGAQDPQWLLEPDLQFVHELVREAGGHLKTMTFAPELRSASELVAELVKAEVIPSVGHTDCDSKTATESIQFAALELAKSLGPKARPTITHLFNGMPPMHHRNPGPVAACLSEAHAGTAVVELIGDGVHLHPQIVKAVFDLVGAENVALVTDSMAATGLPDGNYRLGPATVAVVGRAATLTGTGSLAGGTATLLDVVRQTIAAGVAEADAVLAATRTPARLLRLDTKLGRIASGLRADLLIVNQHFQLQTVLRKGKRLKPAETTN